MGYIKDKITKYLSIDKILDNQKNLSNDLYRIKELQTAFGNTFIEFNIEAIPKNPMLKCYNKDDKWIMGRLSQFEIDEKDKTISI